VSGGGNPVDKYPAPTDPRYGTGCYRRLIRLHRRDARTIDAALEDDPHAVALVLSHDRTHVTAVEARAERFPLTTCSGATGALQSIVGAPLAPSTLALKRHADPRSNCTHLFDLAALAIAHALRDETTREYRIAIPDMVDGVQEAVLERDGAEVLRWTLKRGRITAPAPYAGQMVFGGFTTWVLANLANDDLEHALLLARAVFVASSRMFDMDQAHKGPAAEHGMPLGVCWSYSSPRAEQAYRVRGSRRDFTTTPDALLRWIPL
jgi:hypothetical protein